MANVDAGMKTHEPTAYLVLDTESVPDGKLLGMVKYPGENLSETEAVAKAQAEAREQSRQGSDFLPVTFQYPVAICVVRVSADFHLQAVTALDAPTFRPREMAAAFWKGMDLYKHAKIVTFNGRGFDLPLLEMAAFRYGLGSSAYFHRRRDRYSGHIDLMDWLGNFGACRMAGGLNLLSKLLGKPGKMGVAGDQVYAMHLAGKRQEINDYCLADTLDTYFVFLRTRVLIGELTLEQEKERVDEAKAWIAAKLDEIPGLRPYLANWGDWRPWPA